MSSQWLPNIRKYSDNPVAQRFNALATQLAQYDAHQTQLESTDLPNAINIDNSIIRYIENSKVITKPVSTLFYLPFEPDLNHLTLWLRFDDWTSVIRDKSFFGNDGQILGGVPLGTNGPDKGYGTTVAFTFDGSQQIIDVFDNPLTLRQVATTGSFTNTGGNSGNGSFTKISVSNTATTSNSFTVGISSAGFSVATLVYPSTYSPTISGMFRFICSKVDDPDNMFVLYLDTNGLLHFWVYRADISYSVVSNSVVPVQGWNWIVATFDTSARDQSLNFLSTSNQYVDCTNNSLLAVGETSNSEMSYSVWVKMPATPTVNSGIVGKGNSTGVALYWVTSGKIELDMFYNTHATSFLQSTSNIADGNWHHIVVSNKATGNTQMYVDGVSNNNVAVGDFLKSTGTASFTIANCYATGTPGNGEITNVSVYNVQLTQAEVTILFNNGPVSRGLVANWDFHEGQGTTITDLVNRIVGTLTNGPTWTTDVPTSFDSASKIYLNGVRLATNVDTPFEKPGALGDFAHASTDLFIGANSGGDGFFQGFMSDFRYYREKVLTSSEVTNLAMNYYTTVPIPFGQVLIVGPGAINPGPIVAKLFSLAFRAPSTQYVDCGSSGALKVGEISNSAGTYSLWFKTTGHPTTSRGIYSNSSGAPGMAPYVNTSGILNCDFNFNTHASDFSSTGIDVTDGKWHHVVCSNNSTGNSKLYLDGLLYVNDANGDFLKPTGASSFRIGEVYGGDPFNGQIADVKIFNQELTQAEVSKLFGGVDVTRGRVVNFKMTEGSGTTITDTDNGVVGTLTNGPIWLTDSPPGAI